MCDRSETPPSALPKVAESMDQWDEHLHQQIRDGLDQNDSDDDDDDDENVVDVDDGGCERRQQRQQWQRQQHSRVVDDRLQNRQIQHQMKAVDLVALVAVAFDFQKQSDEAEDHSQKSERVFSTRQSSYSRLEIQTWECC